MANVSEQTSLSNAPASLTSSDHLQAKKSFWQRKFFWFALLGFMAVSAAAAMWFLRIPFLQSQQPAVSLEQPDAWIHSQNFALLPHDLLQVPLLKDMLTEDFVYFYNQDEDWLSLQGAMRRISFEHQLNWSDTLLKNIAAAPADVYLWHDDSHALRYWALSLERDQLTTIAQKLAELKLTADKQIQQIASLSIAGDNVPVLQISLSSRRQMVLAAHKNRLVLLSDVTMASHDGSTLDSAAKQLLSRLLSADVNKRAEVVSEWHVPNNQSSDLERSKQTIMLSNRVFAQGYAAFVPSVRALRFDFDGTSWSSQGNIDSTAFDAHIWKYLPANAAFCVSTPIDWNQVQNTLNHAQALKAPPKLADIFAPTGAACWYASKDDDITQPLFVGLRQSNRAENNTTEALSALFDWGVATNQDYMTEVKKLKRQQRKLTNDLTAAKKYLKSLKAEKIDKTLSDSEKDAAKADLASRKESATQDIARIEKEQEDLKPLLASALEATKIPAQKAKELDVSHHENMTVLSRKVAIDSANSSNPSLAFNEAVVYFSTNPTLLDQGIAVAGKHYPNLQESTPVLNGSVQQLLYVNPSKLSTLLSQTGHAALPQDGQARLRAAFDYHMPARLTALAKHPDFSLTIDQSLPKDNKLWHPLAWHTAP